MSSFETTSDGQPPAPTPRRRFLLAATSTVATVGVVAVSLPLVKSWMPSARAATGGAPVQVDLAKIEPGMQISVKWRSKPVFVLRRTPTILQNLNQPAHLQQLRDPQSNVLTQQPEYAKNEVRAIRDEYLVVVGICTHLGCIPTFRPEVAPADLGEDWVGGYFCPCHGSRYDLAGRVFKGVPAPTNLVVPPYRYLSDRLVEIG